MITFDYKEGQRYPKNDYGIFEDSFTLVLIRRWSYGTYAGGSISVPSTITKALTLPMTIIGKATKKKMFFHIFHPSKKDLLSYDIRNALNHYPDHG